MLALCEFLDHHSLVIWVESWGGDRCLDGHPVMVGGQRLIVPEMTRHVAVGDVGHRTVTVGVHHDALKDFHALSYIK